MDIKFNTQGTILNGRHPEEKFVKILDDKENTGGFIVLLSESGNFSFPHCYDDWVEDLESLQQYLQEVGWVINWVQEK